jgi:acyl transferase domain-containing protein/acyl carrier protein
MEREPETAATGLEIAVIGKAGRFAGAGDLAALWRNLAAGVESISFFSAEELRASGHDPALLDDAHVPARGVLDGADLFDAEFFGYSPREAEVIDPQQRIFLECAWQALEDAGYDPLRTSGLVGVYGGLSTNTYVHNLFSHPEILAMLGFQQVVLANDKDFLCTRVAYKLNLEGPCVDVQTACSTSLVAVHMACQALLGGECDMALAGGVSVLFPQVSAYRYQENGILSPDGHCRAFDAQARGTVMGSGAGIVVLKRLADALRDGDSISAVIRGSAINNDGAQKAGFTAPRIDGQAKVICTAQEIAQVEPETVTYIEAHGTGTELGDPIEIAALTQAFRTGTDERGFCALGSLKTNIGHLDAAAGVAGLLKTVLALEHKLLPPSLHFEQPNPQIDFAASPFYVNTTAAPWPAGPTPRRAGVSSFGLGGTNAHIVLEEAPPAELPSPARPWQLLVLSAKSETALDAMTENLGARLAEPPEASLADVAYTLQVGRREFRWRRAVVCRDSDEARRALAQLDPPSLAPESHRPVVYLFPGQGAQHVDMGRELYEAEEVFRDAVDACAEILQDRLGRDVRDLLYPPTERREEAERLLTETRFAQPALFVVEYALAQLWRSWGVQPAAMIGHSLGEYVAACLAGVFSLPDALALVAARGEMMQRLPGGAMLSVELPAAELERRCGTGLSLAAVNAPGLSVASGPEPLVAALEARLAAEGISARRLRTSHAFHSAMMEPIADAFRDLVRSVALAPPQLPYLSNVTGTWITAAEATDPAYWVRHLLAPVRFAEGIAELWREPEWILLEVGPGHALGRLALKQPAHPVPSDIAVERVVLASLLPERERQPGERLEKALGRLWLAGAAIDWAGVHAGERRRRVSLPTYAFERQRFWIEPEKDPAVARRPAGKIQDAAGRFHAPVWKSAPRPLTGRLEPGGLWLLLLDEHDVGDRLMQRLAAAGIAAVGVRAGEGFRHLGDRLFQIDPRDEAGFSPLLTALGSAPQKIVHLWSLGPEEATDAASFTRTQDRGFYALLSLAQALGKAGHATPIDICSVTDGVLAVERSDRIQPARATLRGALQVIPQEHPNLRCRLIDIDLREHGDRLTERLLAELADSAGEPAVARRGNQRWVPDFAAVRLEPGENPLREGGVYLITGGLGGIGLGLAELLATRLRAKLVLTGRSAVPERSAWPQAEGELGAKLRRIEAMEAAGAEVLALSVDVTNEAQMRRAVALCRERFGALHGVLHTAGLPGSGLIQLKTREAADRVQAPKTAGTLALARALEGVPLDFLALFSSATSIFGGVGQVDYTAANAFLDAFAERRAMDAEGHTVAIDWGEWQWDAWTGAAPLDAEIQRRIERQRQTYGLTFEEGLDALTRALASGLPRVVVLTRDFASYQRHSISDVLGGLESFKRESKGRRHSRPALGSPYVAPRTEEEKVLAGIWEELLGIEPIGIEDSFLAMGGHSLLALQVISRVHAELGVDLPLNVLLESPTIAELAALIVERRPAASLASSTGGGETGQPEAPDLLQSLDELSDEQLNVLLTEILAEQGRSGEPS